MIIPAHTRTIFIEFDGEKLNRYRYETVLRKFRLNIPTLEFSKPYDSEAYRCVAIDSEGKYCIPPFLNMDMKGFVCLGFDPSQIDSDTAVYYFFSTSFNFQLTSAISAYYFSSPDCDRVTFQEFTSSFYENWEKTGKISLIPMIEIEID
jgi:hypothetical protein